MHGGAETELGRPGGSPSLTCSLIACASRRSRGSSRLSMVRSVASACSSARRGAMAWTACAAGRTLTPAQPAHAMPQAAKCVTDKETSRSMAVACTPSLGTHACMPRHCSRCCAERTDTVFAEQC